MSKIRVLSDQLANQIAAGEVVERPASVAKELVENAIDAVARRITIDVEAGGRKLLRVSDDGEGMTRDDAVLAFERHATSKISSPADLNAISTLGFRGEALASIAAVARVELITKPEDSPAATRVLIEGGRMRDVKDAAHPRGTTISVRDLFFNVPARRKFLRSEATESFHLTNLVTHYALAHPEIAFTLTNNGRETLRAAPAADLRERAYQIFGGEFLENLLEVGGSHHQVAQVRGYVSAPRERRTSRDSQYLFINGRFVRDRLVGRALSDGYRSILPHGVYPAALLFLEIPLEEVDVNVHPAKTEVRFRRAAAVADAVREAVRSALASAGFVRPSDAAPYSTAQHGGRDYVPSSSPEESPSVALHEPVSDQKGATFVDEGSTGGNFRRERREGSPATLQGSIAFHVTQHAQAATGAELATENSGMVPQLSQALGEKSDPPIEEELPPERNIHSESALPPLVSAANLVREVPMESFSANIRPLGQLGESFIVAADDEGLLLIDQHVAHERILFDKYRQLEGSRPAESQHLLMPETFDLTPAQATAFDSAVGELETYGFGLMRLSGRTVAIKSVPADLPAGEARNMLTEVLETVDSEKRGTARATLRDEIAASLACRAAIKINTPLATAKMHWLIDRLLLTSSPTTCPHGRPIILRLTTRDIEKGFHRT